MTKQNEEELSLWKLIKEDFSVPKQNDPALQSSIELFFNYPGVWAIINYRVANALHKKGFKRLSRVISGISTFLTKTDIHPGCQIGRRVFIDHAIGVVIGETTIVENDVLIYQGVTLGGVSLNKGKRHPTIKSNSVIGSGAKVLGNITIGKNSRIGANSVVICDVPKNSTAVGVPAKIIKRDDKKCKLSHNDLPDINKEMFDYLLKRVAVLENAVKKYEGIDLSSEDKDLEDIYERFIQAMNSIKQ
ncbi:MULTISPECIES: serine O-acetyltransferase [Malaciobacter]|jgi:serine O-acetyltransferase|uniref:serine O-acetyltransferase n=2 Tax=Malaciobacter TaxID=2321114 RepID=A0AB37A1S4_9BACT|nr:MULTISPECIES: serine O-acetyltransferase [Malaciobacter]PHO11079.1 serine O-acetyltransferase [Malaciobacter canalis]PPK62996.1 serine O-acetyltransferase [Malaciobacter marinus]QEE33162.1 serine O-acetyltransferase [Malaciobacter canalis]SKB67150.1 serine O-acetyltransferase [Malaciobacter marinus]